MRRAELLYSQLPAAMHLNLSALTIVYQHLDTHHLDKAQIFLYLLLGIP